MFCAVKFTKLHPDAKVPSYANGSVEDAGMDLYSIEDKVIEPNKSRIVKTGIAIELPVGHEAQIRPRSGLASKYSVSVNFGTIDPGYRGELGAIMFNFGTDNYYVAKGDRIAQMVVSKYERVVLEEVNQLSESIRGEGGHGSTGV